jgi:hypothetical protein
VTQSPGSKVERFEEQYLGDFIRIRWTNTLRPSLDAAKVTADEHVEIVRLNGRIDRSGGRDQEAGADRNRRGQTNTGQ